MIESEWKIPKNILESLELERRVDTNDFKSFDEKYDAMIWLKLNGYLGSDLMKCKYCGKQVEGAGDTCEDCLEGIDIVRQIEAEEYETWLSCR